MMDNNDSKDVEDTTARLPKATTGAWWKNLLLKKEDEKSVSTGEGGDAETADKGADAASVDKGAEAASVDKGADAASADKGAEAAPTDKGAGATAADEGGSGITDAPQTEPLAGESDVAPALEADTGETTGAGAVPQTAAGETAESESAVEQERAPGPARKNKRRGRRGKKAASAEKPESAQERQAGGQAGSKESEARQPQGEEQTAGETLEEALDDDGTAPGDEQVEALEALEAKQDKQNRHAAKTGKKNKKNKKAEREPQAPQPKEDDQLVVKLLINTEEPEECRIAQLENGRLESLHVASVVRERTKNNIYKGKVISVEPNLQAAFVDIGTGRNGFLPFSDIHPEYYRQDVDAKTAKLIEQQHWKKLKIESVIQKGTEVLVQVVKEVTGNKGANMTTYLSLPGRYLVLMPGSDSAGISRKIGGEQRRRQLREIMDSFNVPEGIGYIVRTASVDITKTALQEDLRYLLRLWRDIKKRGQTMSAPALIYQDQDMVLRFLRDFYTPEIQEILVDTEESFEQVKNFIEMLPAKQRDVRVKQHRGSRPIFNQHNIEEQVESIYQPRVQLPSGGSIVIDTTEALVAIDVNSGRTSKDSDFEETIYLANMEAAAELARQLRLRDLGGLIVVDFIDMRNKKHIREVEKEVKNSMKRDKAKVDVSRISRFGLMQISRQKMGAPIEKGSYRPCEHCQGRGVVKSVETLALYYLRRIQTGISRKKVQLAKCMLPIEVARYLLNKKRAELSELEARHDALIEIIPTPTMKPGDNQIEFIGNNGNSNG